MTRKIKEDLSFPWDVFFVPNIKDCAVDQEWNNLSRNRISIVVFKEQKSFKVTYRRDVFSATMQVKLCCEIESRTWHDLVLDTESLRTQAIVFWSELDKLWFDLRQREQNRRASSGRLYFKKEN